jgi:hypothetical protein
MKIDYLMKKKELVSVVLLCVSAILAVSILVKIVGFFTSTAKAGKIVENASEQNTKDTKDIDKYFTKYKNLADDLKKKNLFAPPAPKQHPVREVVGIFGDEAIIGNRLYKVGDSIGGAKIVLIEPTQVTIEWDGKKKTFSPMDAGSSSGPSGQGGPRPTARRGGPPPPGGSAPMVTVQSQGRPPSGPPMGGFGPGMRERLMNMSEAERDRFRAEMRERRERYMNMSEAEREKFRAEMRERFGGRPPGGGGRGGRGGR